jgi:hypothetical protein
MHEPLNLGETVLLCCTAQSALRDLTGKASSYVGELDAGIGFGVNVLDAY